MPRSPLSVAADRGYEKLAKFLLDQQDVNPNLQEDCGLTPLSKAAREGRFNAISQNLLPIPAGR
jgi:ankyrin repeat protein